MVQLSSAIVEIQGCPVSEEELHALFSKLDLDGHSLITPHPLTPACFLCGWSP